MVEAIGIGVDAVERPPVGTIDVGAAVSGIVVGSIRISIGLSLPLDNVDSAARVGVVAGLLNHGSGDGVVHDGGGDVSGGVVDDGGGVMDSVVRHDGGGVDSGLHLGGGLHHALHGSGMDSRHSSNIGGVGAIGVGMVVAGIAAVAQAAVQESGVGFGISVGCRSSVSSSKQADKCERLHGAL